MSAKKVSDNTAGKRRWLRIVIMLLIYGGLLAGGHWGSGWLISLVGVDLSPGAASHARHVLMAGIALYTALMAVPFVPGMEISVALLAAFGQQVAMYIYTATVAALMISYLIGRVVPVHLIASFLGSLGQHRAETLVLRLGPLNAKQRLETLIAHAPKRIVPTLLKHRYIAVAVALNVPGNAVIGGGGGIALLAGISRPVYVSPLSRDRVIGRAAGAPHDHADWQLTFFSEILGHKKRAGPVSVVRLSVSNATPRGGWSVKVSG